MRRQRPVIGAATLAALERSGYPQSIIVFSPLLGRLLAAGFFAQVSISGSKYLEKYPEPLLRFNSNSKLNKW